MGIRHDVEQGLEKYEITKIDGQPTDEDLNLLIKELTNAAGSVATRNGGGEHGHVVGAFVLVASCRTAAAVLEVRV